MFVFVGDTEGRQAHPGWVGESGVGYNVHSSQEMKKKCTNKFTVERGRKEGFDSREGGTAA